MTIILLLTLLCVSRSATSNRITSSLQTDEDSFLIKVSENTLKLSKLRLFYIFDLSRGICCLQLVKHLHSNGISTVLADVTDLSRYMTDEVSKSIVILVDDCSDVVNLMLASTMGSNRNHSNVNCTSLESGHRRSVLPNICIVYDPKSGASLRDPHRPCDTTINMTVQDIDDGRTLKTELLDLTNGAYNRVWNPDNYLVFVISSDPEEALSCNVFLVFRLVWRIFKGRKTVICSKVECLWYDAFFNETRAFKGARGEEYFDFEWRSMNRKPAIIQNLDFFNNLQLVEAATGFFQWRTSALLTSQILAERRDCDVNMDAVSDADELSSNQHKFVVKHDLFLLLIDSTPRLRRASFENYDHTTVVDFGSLGFLVPRRGFKPQYLTVFKCFSVEVWACFLVTTTTFLLLQYLHKWSQSRQFLHLYSEHELVQYESLSTALTIYRYFLCVAQPRLLLGKLLSGKMLFGVFVFAALILSTLLQSGMVKFLSERIRYADIDTLQELSESNLLVQSTDLESDQELFSREEEFDWLSDRLVGNYHLNNLVAVEELLYPRILAVSETDNVSVCVSCAAFEVGKASLVKSLEAIMTEDAFLSMTQTQSARRDWQLFDVGHVFDYHAVREAVVTYPLMYLVPKHMFGLDEFNRLTRRIVEVGLLSERRREYKWIQDALQSDLTKLEDPRRPFSMRDLRIAFICLGAGYLTSFIVFLLEVAFNLR